MEENPRSEKDILKLIKKHRDKIKELGDDIGKIDDWNDESFLTNMNYHVAKLQEGIELARMYYKHKKRLS